MKAHLPLFVLLGFCFACHAQEAYKLEDMQGAWWSDRDSPTADFAISDAQVWLDFDSRYHPCAIKDDVLVFDLGPGNGRVEHRIVSLDETTLVLENLLIHDTVAYTRIE